MKINIFFHESNLGQKVCWGSRLRLGGTGLSYDLRSLEAIIKHKRQANSLPFILCNIFTYYLFTASDNSAPALNLATFLAAILIFSFDLGLIPS